MKATILPRSFISGGTLELGSFSKQAIVGIACAALNGIPLPARFIFCYPCHYLLFIKVFDPGLSLLQPEQLLSLILYQRFFHHRSRRVGLE